MNRLLSNFGNSIGADDLKAQFVSLAGSPIDSSELNAAGESLTYLCRTDWVKVILIRSLNQENPVIEVEVSIPSCSDKSENESLHLQMEVLTDMMTHLLYIRDLLKIGFEFSVIREDCLWIASKSFSEIPEDEVFTLLLPPGTDSDSLRNKTEGI